LVPGRWESALPYERLNRHILPFACVIAYCSLTPHQTWAAGSRGDVIQTDAVGMSMVTRDFTSHSTKTVADSTNLSEFFGLHYYFINRWRLGMNLQFTEQIAPAPPTNESRFRTFAFLPQLGCNFYDPFFAALVYKIAPRTNGQSQLDMAVQGLLGVGQAISPLVRVNFAIEVPFAFYVHRSLGLTLLTGISIRL
jgi:hypothetical protein